MINKWIKLSEGTYLFGPGGINRVEPVNVRKSDGSLSDYKTALFVGLTKITTVKDTEEEIEEKLQVSYGL